MSSSPQNLQIEVEKIDHVFTYLVQLLSSPQDIDSNDIFQSFLDSFQSIRQYLQSEPLQKPNPQLTVGACSIFKLIFAHAKLSVQKKCQVWDYMLLTTWKLSQCDDWKDWSTIYSFYIVEKPQCFESLYDGFFNFCSDIKASGRAHDRKPFNAQFWWSLLYNSIPETYVKIRILFLSNARPTLQDISESSAVLVPEGLFSSFSIKTTCDAQAPKLLRSYTGAFSDQATVNSIFKTLCEDDSGLLIPFISLLSKPIIPLYERSMKTQSISPTVAGQAISLRLSFKSIYSANVDKIQTYEGLRSLFESSAPSLFRNLIFAAEFDSKSLDFTRIIKNKVEWLPAARTFVSSLAVAFSPLILGLDFQSVEKVATQAQARNKRMKIVGQNAAILEGSSSIFTNPVSFAELIESSENSDPFRFSLDCSKWTKEEAFTYSIAFIEIFGNDLLLLFTLRLCLIQNLFEKTIKMDSSFLPSRLLPKTMAEKSDFKSAFTSSKNIIECSASKDISDESKIVWVRMISQSFKVFTGADLELSISAVRHALTHFSTQSNELIRTASPIFERFDSDLDVFLSIFSIDPSNSDVLSKAKQFVSSHPIDNPSICITAFLLLHDLFVQQKISPKVKEIALSLLDNSDLSPNIRTLTLFVSYLGSLKLAFPEFTPSLVSCFRRICLNPSSSPKNFEFIFGAIADIFLNDPSEKSLSEFFSIMNEVKLKVTDQKKRILAKIFENEFIPRCNQPISNSIPAMAAKGKTLFIASNSLLKLDCQEDSVSISAKTFSNLSAYTVTSETPAIPEIINKNPPNTFKKPKSIEAKFSSTFSEFVNSSDVLQKADPAAFLKPVELKPVKQSNTQKQIHETTDASPISTLISCQSASAISTLLLGDPHSILMNSPFSMLENSSSNAFSSDIRECIKIGVIFAQNSQYDQNSILSNDWNSVPPKMKSFLRSIGEYIDLDSHSWFSGRLDSTNFSNGRYHLFYSNSRFEILFHVAPLLPTDASDQQQIYKKRHIGNDNIHIVWSEGPFDYDTNTITSQFNDAHVIIYPIDESTNFRVSVHKKSPNYNFGPLIEGDYVVDPKELPTLVIWTAIFSDRAAREASSEYKLPSELYEEAASEVQRIMKEEKN